MKFAAVIALALGSTCAIAKDVPQPPAPPNLPDIAKARATAESGIKATLFDPSSAQFIYTSGFQWGYTKPVFAKRTFTWVACGTVNAKNRLGGYVGAQPFFIAVDAAGSVTWDTDGIIMASCYSNAVPPQPELADAPEAAATGRLGVADELAKLADLRAKGVITQAEFDAQKAKLLSR